MPVIGKTGFTILAKLRALLTGAIIVSVLGSRDLWGDTKRLFEFGSRRDAAAPLLQHAALHPVTHGAAQRRTRQRGRLTAATSTDRGGK